MNLWGHTFHMFVLNSPLSCWTLLSCALNQLCRAAANGSQGWRTLALFLQCSVKEQKIHFSNQHCFPFSFFTVSAEVYCDLCLGVLLRCPGGVDFLSCWHLGWRRGWDHWRKLQQGMQVGSNHHMQCFVYWFPGNSRKTNKQRVWGELWHTVL